MQKSQYYIDQLQLQPHPEGGWYAETYRSDVKQEFPDLKIQGLRNLSTAIYFLIPDGSFSAFHRIKSDELWHHYDGGNLIIVVINAAGELDVLKLGKDVEKGYYPQQLVKAGCWFASFPELGADYVLCGCTVSPGFDFQDFELAERAYFLELYPQHEALIEKLTRN
ncbi:MAG: cupin domain-containing protein [Flavobacteriales bacterium]